MKLAELKVSKSAAPASQGAVTPEPVASPAPLEPQSVIPGQMTVDECIAEVPQNITTVTPSGVEIQYEWAPRRLYRLRSPERPDGSHNFDWFEAPSVTTVLGVLDKSGPLVWWAQKTTIESIQGLVDEGVDNILAGTSEDVVARLKEHRRTVNHVTDKAADRGVNVHDALETWCKSGDIPSVDDYPETEQGYIVGLVHFLTDIRSVAEVEGMETMVGSLEHHYAGRFDLVLNLTQPVEVVTKTYPKRNDRLEEIPAGRVLIDLKTSKNVYSTAYLQLEAYEAAAVECGYPPTDYRAVLHVTADGRYELALNQDWTFEDFLSVRRCYQTMNERGVIQALRDELDAKEVK